MALSVATINLLKATGQRPWGIYLFDVDASGQATNVRRVNSAGPRSADIDFQQSIEGWQFAPPAAPAQRCVAEMKLT